LNISRRAERCQPEPPVYFSGPSGSSNEKRSCLRRQQVTLPRNRRPKVDTRRRGRVQNLL